MSETKLGPTGEFPDGKIHESDEGGLKMGVGVSQEGLVEIHFGKPIAWIGLDLESLDSLIATLRNAGIEAARLRQAREKTQ